MHPVDFNQLQNCINNSAADGKGGWKKAISAENCQKLFLPAAPAWSSPGLSATAAHKDTCANSATGTITPKAANTSWQNSPFNT